MQPWHLPDVSLAKKLGGQWELQEPLSVRKWPEVRSRRGRRGVGAIRNTQVCFLLLFFFTYFSRTTAVQPQSHYCFCVSVGTLNKLCLSFFAGNFFSLIGLIKTIKNTEKNNLVVVVECHLSAHRYLRSSCCNRLWGGTNRSYMTSGTADNHPELRVREEHRHFY